MEKSVVSWPTCLFDCGDSPMLERCPHRWVPQFPGSFRILAKCCAPRSRIRASRKRQRRIWGQGTSSESLRFAKTWIKSGLKLVKNEN